MWSKMLFGSNYVCKFKATWPSGQGATLRPWFQSL
jgi:hypothetical protein